MTNSKDRKFAQHIPLFASLFSLLLGLLAAFFSWRAYQMAKETKETILYQMRPNIIVGDSLGDGFDYNPNGEFFCGSRIRFQNVGGKPTSLVGYEVHVSYQDKKIKFSNESTLGYALTDSTVSPALSAFRSVIYTDRAKMFERVAKSDFTGAIQFPVQIEAYSAIDFHTALYYIIDWNKSEPDPERWYGNAVLYSYTFHFSSGQALETAETACHYIIQK